MVAESARKLPVACAVFLVGPFRDSAHLRFALDALAVDLARVIAVGVDFHFGAQAYVERLEFLGSAYDGPKRGRHDDDLDARIVQRVHSRARFGAKTLLTSDNFVIEIAQVFIDLFFGAALERGEHLAAHPCLALRKMQLVGGAPRAHLRQNALAQQVVAAQIAHEQYRRIALDGRSVEIERGNGVLARRLRAPSRRRSSSCDLVVNRARFPCNARLCLAQLLFHTEIRPS